MSAWDDSWGYLWTTPASSWECGGKIRESGTGRCVNTDPLLTTVTRASEEVAGMTPSYLDNVCDRRNHSVTNPDGAA